MQLKTAMGKCEQNEYIEWKNVMKFSWKPMMMMMMMMIGVTPEWKRESNVYFRDGLLMGFFLYVHIK